MIQVVSMTHMKNYFFFVKILQCELKINLSSYLDESDVKMLTQNDSTETLLLDNQQQQQQQQPDHVPSTIPKKESEEIILLEPDEQQSAQIKQQQQCDDNQNNMNINNNNRMIMMQNFNINASSERILVNLKQLLALYARLKRQLMEFTDVKENEQSSYKEKCDEMSSQVRNS
jgi:hypothetical protein